ncbi:UPF0696 like protein [Termitomyces sp. T112]|nr:UPF0696 like protein [Termitomyces sp. T112]
MSKSEDVINPGYTYSWNTDSVLPLQDFLTKYKPSMVQNDGKKPWIWVQGSAPTHEERTQEAIEEASALLKEVTQRVEAIKNDESIPLRSNKKTGVKSKKEVREQVQAEATEKLKEIAIKHGYVSGKWLIFASADKVDTIWSNLAKSLVSGPLASTFAYLAKVATSPESRESPNYQHLICVYIPDVYDKVRVTEVMKILLRNHGIGLSGVKSDLYTALGIDSKHASGLPSTTWKNSALISDAESKELRDAFFADLASNKVTPAKELLETATSDVAAAASKPKPKLKKKADVDPFASDNDDGEGDEENKRKQELQAKVKRAVPKKKATDDAFASNDEEDEAKRKEEAQAKKAKSALFAKKRQVSDVGDEDQRPRKRKPAKSQDREVSPT